MTNQLSIRTIDLPAIHRFGVGFDRVFDRIDEIIRNTSQQQNNYPPHNIIQTGDDTYVLELAVAGFTQGEISIEVQNNVLSVSGKHTPEAEAQDSQPQARRDYLHRGISGRDFSRTWPLGEHVEVMGASQENGILSIQLERRVPDALKPRQIAIAFNK
jgi:molecular chaperone IbpA